MMRATSSPWAALPIALLAACSDGAPATPTPDAAPLDQTPPLDQAPPDQPALDITADGLDAEVAAPPDAAEDAPPDATEDAPPDATEDAPPDAAAPDATQDAPGDAAEDAPGDAAPPDAPDDLPPPPCARNADCASSAAGPVCDTATGACVPCTAADRGACAAGQYCTDARRCEAGCAADADCAGAAARCDVAAHRCVACVTDAHCPAGSLCGADRACAPGCNAAHACPAGRGCCAGLCLDTAGDVAHCGGCDVACRAANATPACRAGACAVAACDAGFGDCDGAPGNGCEVDTRVAAAHCGGCGRACAAGGSCVAGACAPPPPASCAVILRRDPSARSGTYTVHPAGAPIEVTCDFSTGRGYTFFRGPAAPATAAAILGACPAGTGAFQVRSEAHAAALRRYVVSPAPADRWYHANFFAGPASTCPTLAAQGGWLRAAAEWVDASVRPAALAPLDMAENCLNAGAFDPVPLNDRVGYANRGCSGCRVLYNQSEQDLTATVVCGVNDLPACATGAEDCDGDAGNGCEVRVDVDAAHCGACNRRCAAGETCSAGACALRRAGTFLPPPPAGPASSPEVMATGIAGPQGLVVAPDGRVYVSALSAGTIVRIDPAVTPPTVTLFAGGFSEPAQLAMNAPDAIVVAERAAGRVTRVAVNADGSAGARTTVATGFAGPWGVTWEPSGSLLVSNEFGDSVDRVAPSGAVTRAVVSGFNGPLDMRYDADGRLWVAQYFGTALGNGTLVHLYDASLARLRSAAGFSGPIGVALDAAGAAYVSSYDGGAAGGGRVLRVTPEGAVSAFATGLTGPHAVAFDARGALWVCDYGANRVVRIVTR